MQCLGRLLGFSTGRIHAMIAGAQPQFAIGRIPTGLTDGGDFFCHRSLPKKETGAIDNLWICCKLGGETCVFRGNGG